MDPKVREILTGMKAELSKGWIQGDIQDDDGVCLYGALVRAGDLRIGPSAGHCPSIKGRETPAGGMSFFIPEDTPEGNAMIAISNELGVEMTDLALWQDDPSRTVDDVVAVIDRVLLKEESKPTRRSRVRKRVRELVS